MMTPTKHRIAEIPAVLMAVLKLLNSTSVGPSLTRLAFCNPIKAINKPIPALTACFKDKGIASNIASRTRVSERIMKIIPSINTANNAVCQL